MIDLNVLLAGITLPTTGAAAIFTGMVRGVTRRDTTEERDGSRGARARHESAAR